MIFKFVWFLRAIVYKLIFNKVGWLSYLGKPIFLFGAKNISIGNKVRIYPHCRMETYGNDGFITIEENCSIGQSFHIISGEGQNLIIGKNTTVSANVFITNIEHNYSSIDVHIMDQPLSKGDTQIGENCFIGYGAVIQAGTILGKQCIIGANAVVRGAFSDYSIIVGAPAQVVKRYNEKSQLWEKTNKKGEFLNEI